MTNRQFFWVLLAIAVIATLGWLVATAMASPAKASCHKFSIWKYPWPQRCGISAKAFAQAPAPIQPKTCSDYPEMCYLKDVKPDVDIPLPSLENMEFPPECIIDWCQRLKGIGLLREKFGTN